MSGEGTGSGGKESWDYETFVRCYDEIAVERHSCSWTGAAKSDELRRIYEVTSPPTIRGFALASFMLDQEY